MIARRYVAAALGLLVFGLTMLTPACADNYPSKLIRLVVPTSAGSTSDVRARQIAERLSAALKQPVIVDNRAGAGETIAADFVAKAAPDGYTILYGTIANLAIAPAFYPNLPYDPRRDFAPITQQNLIPPILVVSPKLGVRTPRELIALAKSKPGQLTCGSRGNGTITQLLLLQLNREAGIDIVHVPYKNSANALTDVVAGHIDMIFDYTPTSMPLITAGRLVPVLTVGHKRSKLLPDVSSAEEAGLPRLEHKGWSGFLVPVGTPKDIVKRLNAELVRIVRSPELAQFMVDSGGEAVGNSPEEFAAFIRSEQESMAALVKATGARAE